MPLFSKSEKNFVTTLGRLIDCNPFLPERMKLEKKGAGRCLLGSRRQLESGSDDLSSIGERDRHR